MTARNILIFRSYLLSYSETFIVEQAENLRRYLPWYAGFTRIPGLSLPPERVITLADSRGWFRFQRYASMLGWMFLQDKEKALADIGAELIHAHFETEGIQAIPLSKFLRIPLVVTCHGNDVTARQPIHRKVISRLRRPILHRHASTFIAVSGFIRDRMLRLGYPAEKIHVHHIGIDTERFSRPASPASSDGLIVLFVGRLVEKKGCVDLIRAMSRMRGGIGARLVIIGDGPLRNSLEALAGSLGVKALFLGVQDPASVHDWMSRAAVFSLPSVQAADGDCEGLPMVVCEAASMELPVVSTRHAGIPEAVVHGETGLLADERAPDQLAQHLSTLLENAPLRESMGRAGRAHVVKNFNIRIQSQKLEELYDHILRLRKPA